jgi:DNA modification methylase
LDRRLDILTGDCRDILPTLEADSVQCCVTSPPYWGLRDYGTAQWEGGSVWCEHKQEAPRFNGPKQTNAQVSGHASKAESNNRTHCRLKPKDLCMMPARLAMALQADGWYLRSEIVWHKPNPMPESVTDRPTKAHEMIYLLAKRERYFYDAEAIREPSAPDTHDCNWTLNGKTAEPGLGIKNNNSFQRKDWKRVEMRNKRSVWTIATQPYAEAHFATFPEDLIKPCICAGSRVGDCVLDPFGGSGTTGKVALELGRRAILIELNPAYVELAHDRTNVTPGWF